MKKIDSPERVRKKELPGKVRELTANLLTRPACPARL